MRCHRRFPKNLTTECTGKRTEAIRSQGFLRVSVVNLFLVPDPWM
jgi:hypothetical protein